MRRDLATLADQTHDLLIVGGGIYGAVAAWDASLRGLSVALVERADFGGATSANSLKIVHGGLRYLQQANLARMRESIRERGILLRIAPHLVRPLAFLVATYGLARRGKPALGLAMKITDLVGFDRNRDLPADRAIPNGHVVSREKCLEMFPGFEPDGLTGGAVWYDCQARDSERLTLSFLLGAAEKGAVLANYVEAKELLVRNGAARGVRAVDGLTGQELDIRSRVVLDAAGPWAGEWLGRPAGTASAPRKAYALGINLVTRGRIADHAVGIPSRTTPEEDPVCGGGRFMFLTPWRGSTLIGTSYRVYNGSPGELRVTERDLEGLIDECNAACPALDLSMQDVSFYHRGLVWLKDGTERGRPDALAEEALIVDHDARDGLAGALTMSGVKYTTARGVARRAIDAVLAKLGREPVRCRTDQVAVYGGESVAPAVPRPPEGAGSGSSSVAARLAESHGSRAGALVAKFAARPGWSDPLCPGAQVLAGEVLHAVHDEMAFKLEDVVFRRTQMGAEACPPPEQLEAASRLMARELAWSDARRREEVGRVLEAYRPLPAP